ncbi:ATP-binding cassette domain-containing protein [Streptomyces sp. HUAS 31]|uniref:ATP-binding cassette domain-containing protein n=1 Tax=Streptomyces sp. HUAS 31 TaxID=3020055 RepID=UPI002306DA00|nr:ATP-binding cassette domain-containing protein [Streptomyces sp. HUAS 31]WCE01397.1 ATP-binding cassette domain-containing protein [Streptomyces sp. HUAS 31]
MTGRLPARGLRFLRARRRVVVRLGLWSVLETGQSFLIGYAPARALDGGFLAGRTATGLAWLGVAGLGVVVGAYGTARVYAAVAALVEPLRDRLVRRVVERGVREADRGALSGLTQQVEIARDTFAGLVMVSRSFVFTAVGALAGLFSLAPLLLLVVLPPLAAGIGLFAATLRPLARRQEVFLAADEALADRLGAVCPGLRDITASGAQERTAADVGRLVDAEERAARSLARFGVVRVAALALGGQLPIVLLLATAPWLLKHGVTTGALVGALSYVTQSLLPALHNLLHGLGTSGSRLTVVLRRLAPEGGRGAGLGPSDESGAAESPAPTTARPPALAAAESPATTVAPPPAVTLSSVTFAYGPAAVPVIEDLDLTLPAGSHLAVVGPSGIGKSTLTALVAGLLEPRCGTVQVAGEPVRGAGALARRVLIPQEAYVFTGTLAENLAHLRADPVPEAELLAAAEAVGLLPLLEALGGPEGRVDPAALSAGERQLIALTRAHLSHAPLALLDEATCHLDPRAEERAERAFAARPGGTLVVVAHRITSARRADRVLMMDGRDTAYGTHDELVRCSARYRELVGAWTPVPHERSDPSLALRDPDGVDAVAGPGLAGDGRHVVAHGPVGQVQTPRDLGDGRAFRGKG